MISDQKTSFAMTQESLELLSAKVKEFSGLNYPENRFHDLAKSMANFLKYSNIVDPKDVMSSFEAISEFCVFLTVGETYFFRHKSHFEYIVNLLKNKFESNCITPCTEVRIWSAACSTGEEPYSIAIALNEAGLYDYGIKIRIFASDMNGNSIHKAKTAIYSDWSFRENLDDIRDKYFTKVPNTAGNGTKFRALDNKIKSKVEFFRNNLVTTSVSKKEIFSKPFDIIMCRNVMIYFSYETIKELGHLFFSMLNDGGSLIVSPAETSLMSNMRIFKGIDIGTSFVFEKKPLSQTIQEPKPASIVVSPKPKSVPTIPKKIVPDKKSAEIQRSKIETPKVRADLKSLYDSRKYNEVIKNYSQEISAALRNSILTTNQTDSIKMYIRSLINESKLEEAENICSKALEIQKLDTEFYFIYSKILIEVGKNAESIKQLKKVIFLDSKNLIGHFLLGNLLLLENSKIIAKKHFENVLTILSNLPPDKILEEADGSTVREMQLVTNSILYSIPEYESTLYEAQNSSLTERKPDEKITTLKAADHHTEVTHKHHHKIVQKHPDHLKNIDSVKTITYEKKNHDIKDLFSSNAHKKIVELYKDDIASLLRKTSLAPNEIELIRFYIKSLIKESLFHEAEKICSVVLLTLKLDIELHFLLAKIFIETNKTQDAIKQLKKVIFLDNKNLIGHYLLANLLLSENSKSMAKKHFENVLSILSSQSPDKILEEADGSTVKEIQMVTTSILSTLTSENINK